MDLEAWEAVFGPVGDNGYPKPLWDKMTGKIDHKVAPYWKNHGYDLSYYLEKNWSKIGPELVEQIGSDFSLYFVSAQLISHPIGVLR